MANDKELLKKLYAIVAKQQKIIVKMAQAVQTFKNAVSAVLPSGVTLVSAGSAGDGGLLIVLNKSPSATGNPGDVIRTALVGKTIQDDAGQDYQVTSNKYAIQIQMNTA